MGADLLKFEVPEVADVVSGKKKLSKLNCYQSIGRQTLRKQLGSGMQKKSIAVKKLKRSSLSGKDNCTILANY